MNRRRTCVAPKRRMEKRGTKKRLIRNIMDPLMEAVVGEYLRKKAKGKKKNSNYLTCNNPFGILMCSFSNLLFRNSPVFLCFFSLEDALKLKVGVGFT